MSEPETLADVKAGDKVWLFPGRGEEPVMILVDHVTPTRILSLSYRYRRDNGYRFGPIDPWYGRPNICVGEKARTRIADLEKKLRQRLAEMKFSDTRLRFSQDGIKALRAACDQAEGVLREIGEWREDMETTT